MSGYIDSPAHQFRQSFNSHADVLLGVAGELDRLSAAFSTVGNDRVSGLLYQLSSRLEASLEQLRNSDNDKINYECDESLRMMSSTFAAAQAVLGQVGGVGVGLGSVDVG